MIVPNKIISLNESIIGKMIFILEHITEQKYLTIEDLFRNTRSHFEEIDEFILSLDVLYLLDAIEVEFSRGEATYVSGDQK
ncbi:ABC-three component system middle component 7 [Bacillus sp. FSL K6-4563]|uniref:ABC-three component system middle component 7 n=1 Tax=Bacillus sp. FSL K6-4563 TaxID=2921507 RepID=UPI00315B07C9